MLPDISTEIGRIDRDTEMTAQEKLDAKRAIEGEYAIKSEKLNIVHVPYKGSGLALIGLASGQVDMQVLAAPAAIGQIQAGRVRALAVLSPERMPDLPNVPTAREQGFPNFDISVWYGMLAPAGTPREIVNRLNAELIKAVTAPDMKPKLAQAGVEPLTSTPEEFGSFIKTEAARFEKVIKEAGIKGE